MIFPVLHGPFGEDGTIQGLLELANVPYVGAGVLASAVGHGQGHDEGRVRGPWPAGLRLHRRPRPRLGRRTAPRSSPDLERALGFPMFVKPANLGSSVGISKAKDAASLAEAMDLARSFDRRIIVEAAVPEAREIECAVIGNDDPKRRCRAKSSRPASSTTTRRSISTAASQTVIPADLPAATAAEVRRMSIEAFRAIDCAGMARVDFLLSRQDGALFVNEVNTIPGFTTISMYSKMWAASGVDYPALLDRLIALALERHAARQQLRTSVT